MTHDAMGRTMARLAADGRVADALEGGEAVYWLTPGTRYVRMVEKLLFGDTNHLFLLLISGTPILVFLASRHFAPPYVAWLITAAFWVLPAGTLSFTEQLTNALAGYGDAIGVSLFFLGVVLMLRTQPAWGGTNDNRALVWAAGAALAAAMFVRPNFAFAVVWMGAAYAWASRRSQDLARIAALALGLGLALWLPFHNWYYGGKFYLISQSRALTVSLGPRDYLAAAGDVLRGRTDTSAMAVVAPQLRGWLVDPGLLYQRSMPTMWWAAYAVNLLSLAVACWIALQWAVRRSSTGGDLAVTAVAALLAHAPMLFIFDTDYRYAMLGWNLSLVVSIGWIARAWRTRERSTRDGIPAGNPPAGDRRLAVGHTR
jgi:hypothetical protein